MGKLSVTQFAKKHAVSRMTVLRRIDEGELPATRTLIAPAGRGRPARYEWRIEADAPFTKYQAGRPPKLSELEEVLVRSGAAAAHTRKPAGAALKGLATVTSIFDRRRR